MIYESERWQLKCVQIVRKTPANDILICQDMGAAGLVLYTLLVIKDHEVAKRYLEVFEEAPNVDKPPYVDSFSMDGCFCMVFPYKKERSIHSFYMGESYQLTECEDICISLVLACLTANVPYPILYLILAQEQIHLAKDHSVYFSYQLDLTDLDKNMTECHCVVQCARILMKLLKSKETQKATSYILLQKKTEKKSYHQFTELYKDIRIAAVPKKKKSLMASIRSFFARHKDSLFRIMLYLCAVLAVMVALSFISQMIFGEVVWLRLFINGFKKIGTESLLQ